jgi:hypothetical protein
MTDAPNGSDSRINNSDLRDLLARSIRSTHELVWVL